ncbi:MAG: glutaredoxin family protein [Bryobacteraceae bacterium]
MADIKVYGADWCSMTKRTLAHLDQLRVPYEYVDIDDDRRAASWVAAQNDGKEKKPTVDIAGYVLSEPSNQELDDALREKGFGV